MIIIENSSFQPISGSWCICQEYKLYSEWEGWSGEEKSGGDDGEDESQQKSHHEKRICWEKLLPGVQIEKGYNNIIYNSACYLGTRLCYHYCRHCTVAHIVLWSTVSHSSIVHCQMAPQLIKVPRFTVKWCHSQS